MNWSDFAPWLTAPGAGLIGYVFLRRHLSAVNAHREAKNEWRELALEREKQLMEIFGAVREAKDKVP